MLVYGREAVDDQNNRANQALEQQKLVQDFSTKLISIMQVKEDLRIKAKQTENEGEKIKMDSQVADLDYLGKLMKMGMDNPSQLKQIMANGLKIRERVITHTLSDPSIARSLEDVHPTGDERLKGAAANVLERQFPQGNAAQVNALQGAPMPPSPVQPGEQPMQPPQGAGWMGPDVSSINVGGVNIDFPEVQARMAALKKTSEMQAQKIEGQTVGETTAKDWSNKSFTAKAANDTVNTLLQNPNFRTYMGSFGGPKRAFAPFSKEGSLYTGFQSKAMDILNGYRTMVTGAQASEKELDKFIGVVIGRPEKDTYESFLVKNIVGAATAIGKIQSDIKTYKGYDTTALQETLPELQANLSASIAAVKQQTGMDVNKVVTSLGLTGNMSDIVKVMTEAAIRGTPVSYEAARRAVTKSKK